MYFGFHQPFSKDSLKNTFLNLQIRGEMCIDTANIRFIQLHKFFQQIS